MQTVAAGISPRRRTVLVSTELIVGIGALYGGYGLLSDADGLGAKQSWLDGSPFPDYTVPGMVPAGGDRRRDADDRPLSRSSGARRRPPRHSRWAS